MQGPPALGCFGELWGVRDAKRYGHPTYLIAPFEVCRRLSCDLAVNLLFFAVCIPFPCCFGGSQLLTEARLNLQFSCLGDESRPCSDHSRRPQRAASRSGMVATTRVRSSTVPAYMRTYMQLHAQPDAHSTHEAPLGKTTSINPKSPNPFKPSRAYVLNPAPQELKTWQGFGSMAC